MTTSRYRYLVRSLFCVAILLFPMSLSGAQAQGNCSEEAVPLHVWDVITRPNRPWVFSVRTCRPRGLTQGAILLRRPDRLLPPIRKARVFSGEDNAMIEILPGMDDSELVASFFADGETIAVVHGPLIALLMEEEQGLAPGMVFDLTIDPQRTSLEDDDGLVDFCPHPARLHVVSENAPFLLDVRDRETTAGGTALVAFTTYELQLLRRLEVTVTYDPTFFTAVTDAFIWDVRGEIVGSIDTKTPGIVRVEMTSVDGWINVLPGPFAEVEFQVKPDAVIGEESVLKVRQSDALVEFRSGEIPNLELRAGTVTVVE